MIDERLKWWPDRDEWPTFPPQPPYEIKDITYIDRLGVEEVLARFLDNMSERARGMFKDDMDARGPVRVADVEDAQKKIMRLARKLSDTGELILGGADFV